MLKHTNQPTIRQRLQSETFAVKFHRGLSPGLECGLLVTDAQVTWCTAKGQG